MTREQRARRRRVTAWARLCERDLQRAADHAKLGLRVLARADREVAETASRRAFEAARQLAQAPL